jgi:hypothetical protein
MYTRLTVDIALLYYCSLYVNLTIYESIYLLTLSSFAIVESK